MRQMKNIGVLLFALTAALAGCGESNEERHAASVRKKALDLAAVERLVGESVYPMQLQGELSDTFAPFSEYTDLQRDNMKKKVIGRVIQWDLPVYEISLSNETYKVTTGGKNLLTAAVFITARSDDERSLMNSLKTNDIISFKGRITDIMLRSVVVIDPAILDHSKKAFPVTPSASANVGPEVIAPARTSVTDDGTRPAIVDVPTKDAATTVVGVTDDLSEKYVVELDGYCNVTDDCVRGLTCIMNRCIK